jgi:hypothetical protein
VASATNACPVWEPEAPVAGGDVPGCGDAEFCYLGALALWERLRPQ